LIFSATKCQIPSKRRTTVRPSVRLCNNSNGRRVAATSTRRDSGDRGGRCCRACLSVRPSVS